jgi:hypothetical protein
MCIKLVIKTKLIKGDLTFNVVINILSYLIKYVFQRFKIFFLSLVDVSLNFIFMNLLLKDL